MGSNIVSKKLLHRLPVYLDYLRHLPEDCQHISATAMAKALGLGEVQVRKDLAKVSHAGRRRTGRNREQLIRDIESYLDFATETGTIVVGAGKLGQALMDYSGFQQNGLNIMAGFDLSPVADHSVSGKPIYHISRLEALKLQMQQSLEVMFGNQLDSIDSTMRGLYKSGYYRTAFEIQKGFGVGWDFASLDDKTIAKVINKPWAVDGKNFSERIWGNRQKLVNELNQVVTRNIMLGQDPQKAIDEIALI